MQSLLSTRQRSHNLIQLLNRENIRMSENSPVLRFPQRTHRWIAFDVVNYPAKLVGGKKTVRSPAIVPVRNEVALEDIILKRQFFKVQPLRFPTDVNHLDKIFNFFNNLPG